MCYSVTHPMERERFDPDRLNPEEPFEIDERNRPHLYKHMPNLEGRSVRVGEEDLLDLWIADEPRALSRRNDKGSRRLALERRGPRTHIGRSVGPFGGRRREQM